MAAIDWFCIIGHCLKAVISQWNAVSIKIIIK